MSWQCLETLDISIEKYENTKVNEKKTEFRKQGNIQKLTSIRS